MDNSEKNPQILKKAKARVNFKIHLVVYLLSNILFWLFWIFLGGGGELPWPIFPSGVWGIIVIFHYLMVFYWNQKLVDKEYERLVEKEIKHNSEKSKEE